MPRGQPEAVIHGATWLAGGGGGKGRGAGGLLPAAALVGGTEQGGAQVAGPGRRKQGAPVTGVEHQVVDAVAQEVGAVDPPVLSPVVGVEQPGALAGGDQQNGVLRHDPLLLEWESSCPRTG